MQSNLQRPDVDLQQVQLNARAQRLLPLAADVHERLPASPFSAHHRRKLQVATRQSTTTSHTPCFPLTSPTFTKPMEICCHKWSGRGSMPQGRSPLPASWLESGVQQRCLPRRRRPAVRCCRPPEPDMPRAQATSKVCDVVLYIEAAMHEQRQLAANEGCSR